MIGDERLAEHDGVAAKTKGVLGADLHAVGLGDAGVDGLERAAVERGGVVHKAAVGQWGEASIEMIKALVDQAQRNNFAPENFREPPVREQSTAYAVARPEDWRALGARMEKRIAFAFERELAGKILHHELLFLKPPAKMRHLRRALRHAENGRYKHIIQREAGVGDEAHIRQMRRGLHHAHLGALGDDGVESVPLVACARGVGAADVALHPRVDFVLHAKMRRAAHRDDRLRILSFGWVRHTRRLTSAAIVRQLPIAKRCVSPVKSCRIKSP